MNIHHLKPFIKTLCKIFLIGLLFQFFIQTFVTFQLGWDGSFRNFVRMRKEFILLLLCVAVGYASLLHLPAFLKTPPQQKNLWEFLKKYPLTQGAVLFVLTALLFMILAIGVQKVGWGAFLLSVKYDLLPFFIFGLGVCLALLFFTEEDALVVKGYRKLIVFCLWGGLLRWVLVYLMPNGLKFFGYDNFAFEGTIGSRPPAAYYTLINKGFVRNQFLFERPISFGFWLVAFFPVFALSYLGKKSLKKQILFTIAFGLLVLSTRSRGAIVIFGLEVFAIALLLHRKILKKWLWLLLLFGVIGIGGMVFWGQRLFAREHSNTGHLVLIQEGRNIVKPHLISGRGAGYAGPASHQLCYTSEKIDIFSTDISHSNPRCEQIRTVNIAHQISTYGYNPENQYLQILMEYGIFGLLVRGAMLIWIVGYTAYTLWTYRKTEKSAYQKRLYYSMLGFAIGLVGLCGEGMVLHSLVDRMVVYPFFLLYGLTLGLREKAKDIVYIPEKKLKKRKKGKVKRKKKQ